ncbi:MAG: hypothetical protein LUD69_06340 [Oscillospiraceae bacterium]|nr:hypothetical protein [Oscillospiraceae bacterium]
MGKKILNSKLLYALLAVLISIGLWFYVVVVEEPDSTIEISGIPITFTNEDVLEERGLMITDGQDQTVTLTVTGPSTTLAQLNNNKSNITLSIDVSRITSAGEQQMAYTISLPTGYSLRVTVTDRSPSNVGFTVSNCVSKEIQVYGSFTGTLADGYMRDEFEITPGTITVSGPEEEVKQISYALVSLDGEELSESVTVEEAAFTLVDAQGAGFTGDMVTCSVETVEVTMPVVKTAEVPLSVNLLPGGGITEENMEEFVECVIEPAQITVSGEEEALSSLTELVLGEIDLAAVEGTETFTFDIPLDSALKNISGTASATVTITISSELTIQIFEADNIELQNVPDGFEAESVTQTLQVLVRGTKSALTQVLSQNIRVVADLSDIEQTAGRYTVPATIYLDTAAEDAGVFGDNYQIVLDLTQSTE